MGLPSSSSMYCRPSWSMKMVRTLPSVNGMEPMDWLLVLRLDHDCLDACQLAVAGFADDVHLLFGLVTDLVHLHVRQLLLEYLRQRVELRLVLLGDGAKEAGQRGCLDRCPLFGASQFDDPLFGQLAVVPDERLQRGFRFADVEQSFDGFRQGVHDGMFFHGVSPHLLSNLDFGTFTFTVSTSFLISAETSAGIFGKKVNPVSFSTSRTETRYFVQS